MVLSDSVDADLFAFAQDELEASVQVFFVRGGRIRGQRGWIVEKVNDGGETELIEQLLVQVYGEMAANIASAAAFDEDSGLDATQHEIPPTDFSSYYAGEYPSSFRNGSQVCVVPNRYCSTAARR